MDHVTDQDATDEAAFRSLFTATYGNLWAYARRRSMDPSEADDIVAEVYAAAWRRRADIDREAQPLPWLYGIAANVIRNTRRAGSRRLQLVERLQAQPQRPGTDGPAAAVDAPGAEVREALERLSVDDREVLRLVAWEGLSHDEAGRALGCTANAVGIRIHRARRRLQAELAPEWPGSPEPSVPPEPSGSPEPSRSSGSPGSAEPSGSDPIGSRPAISENRRRGGANR